jgi:hypothetical protein
MLDHHRSELARVALQLAALALDHLGRCLFEPLDQPACGVLCMNDQRPPPALVWGNEAGAEAEAWTIYSGGAACGREAGGVTRSSGSAALSG